MIVCAAWHIFVLLVLGTQSKCIEVVSHLERIIVAKSSVLIKSSKSRRVPRWDDFFCNGMLVLPAEDSSRLGRYV